LLCLSRFFKSRDCWEKHEDRENENYDTISGVRKLTCGFAHADHRKTVSRKVSEFAMLSP